MISRAVAESLSRLSLSRSCCCLRTRLSWPGATGAAAPPSLVACAASPPSLAGALSGVLDPDATPAAGMAGAVAVLSPSAGAAPSPSCASGGSGAVGTGYPFSMYLMSPP